MTITEPEALQAMLAHHRALVEGVRLRADECRAARGDGEASARAATELLAYLAGEVLPHARAEEQTVYRIARAHEELASTLDEMVAEHEALAATTQALAEAPDSVDAPVRAEQLASVFSSHVAKENDIVLPVLVADPAVDLAQVLAEMQGLFEAAQQGEGSPDEAGADPTGVVVSLLLEATKELARAGEGDRACQLAAAAWACLHTTRAKLAVQVTAALHGLARQAIDQPVTFGVARGSVNQVTADPDLDVRALAPAQRHQSIFATYGELAPGTGFVLVNDHDPKPLRYQFEAEHTGQYTWDSIEAGPTVWRVRIGRPASPAPPAAAAVGARGQELPELDVRPLAHARRHESIFAAFQALAAGSGFALVNDHDPRPLRYQFEAQFPGQYTWDYLEEGPQVWRVRIGRPIAV